MVFFSIFVDGQLTASVYQDFSAFHTMTKMGGSSILHCKVQATQPSKTMLCWPKWKAEVSLRLELPSPAFLHRQARLFLNHQWGKWNCTVNRGSTILSVVWFSLVGMLTAKPWPILNNGEVWFQLWGRIYLGKGVINLSVAAVWLASRTEGFFSEGVCCPMGRWHCTCK